MKFICKITFLLPVACFAVVWYVHPDSAMNNIDTALDSCAQNDTVLVGPGTYYENIWWPATRGINLISEYGPDTTIIDGQEAGRTIYIPPDGADSSGKVHGFTIQKGHISFNWGGGVYCLRDGFIISNNVITDNYSGFGGGIGCYFYGAPIIINNTISNNRAGDGGGIAVERCSPTISNNIIIGNRANQGGGTTIRWYTNVLLQDNVFINNTAYNGGALFIDDGDVYAIHNDFSSNSTIGSYTSAGIGLQNHGRLVMDSCNLYINLRDALTAYHSSSVTLHYCNIVGNIGYGVNNLANSVINAEYNWWGDASGPYHPDSNPGGLGDSVSDNVDFIPWLDELVSVWEQSFIQPVHTYTPNSATIFCGPLRMPSGKDCKIFDITGRQIHTLNPAPGIYFIEVDGEIRQKVIKIK
jgi:hypothetical protein